ncbi:S8/S53 family peptidase [Pelagibius sp.]|uniref:S8/S53 family peptidase n=1 Tax=Pelagibius sp. TaxID=1931238 RepID=UPI002605CA74|nr:S8/S53 family peptidase [Pelagibius sp.]
MSNRNWHIKEIRADEAWQIMVDPATGDIDYKDVRIAHIDTGYTEHAVFGPWNGEPNNLITDQWTNFIETDERSPRDPLNYKGFPGHGTRIGSVMYGNLPGTMRGVAPDCPVVPYRATNTVVLSRLINRHVSAIGKAIRHAVNDTDCSVISMSLGTPGIPFGSPAKNMGRAVDHAYDCGVITVAASGNNVSDHVTYPGKYFRSICAGGISPNRTIWREHAEPFRGFIDIFAPADEIFRADATQGDGRVGPGEYAETGDGTSYATACTAAAAALWLAHRSEELNTVYEEPWMTIEAFRSMLKSTAAPLAETRPGVETGVLNIVGLLTEALPEARSLEYESRLASKQFA